jgi:putative (di)nucleoside polyphosphate hydrolase
MARSTSDHRSAKARPRTVRSHRARNKGVAAQRGARHKTFNDLWRSEPSLTMLLAEPDIQSLMRADRVDVPTLLAELNAVSYRLKQNAGLRRTEAKMPKQGSRRSKRQPNRYRSGVGIMLLNRQGKVFVARRVDVTEEAWQMPQGGINRGESPREAALRELREEIGTDDAEIIAESKGWFYYDVPDLMAQAKWHGRWRGQRQKWFVMVFKGREADINLATETPEFNAWRWVSLQDLGNLAVSFKRQLYMDVVGEFATIFRD